MGRASPCGEKELGETLHDAGTLIAAARAGDIECTEAWNRYLDDLSNALVSLINILDPEIIAVGKTADPGNFSDRSVRRAQKVRGVLKADVR